MSVLNKIVNYLKSKAQTGYGQDDAQWNLNPVEPPVKSIDSDTYVTQSDADGVISCRKLGEIWGSPICIWDGLPEETVDD